MDILMTQGADLLLILGSFGAAIYCLILSRRLSRLSSIDKGLGGAIAVLSAQVDDMSKTLDETRNGSEHAAARLQELTDKAERMAGELQVLLSACHDLAEAPSPEPAPAPQAQAEVVPAEASFRSQRQPEPEEAAIPLFLRKRVAGQVGGM